MPLEKLDEILGHGQCLYSAQTKSIESLGFTPLADLVKVFECDRIRDRLVS